MRSKTLKLKQIDLEKCCNMPGKSSDFFQWHKDIKESKQYLAKIDGYYFVGEFFTVWYGWSFDGWGGGGGLQLDNPGTNSSMWEGLWEIQ